MYNYFFNNKSIVLVAGPNVNMSGILGQHQLLVLTEPFVRKSSWPIAAIFLNVAHKRKVAMYQKMGLASKVYFYNNGEVIPNGTQFTKVAEKYLGLDLKNSKSLFLHQVIQFIVYHAFRDIVIYDWNISNNQQSYLDAINIFKKAGNRITTVGGSEDLFRQIRESINLDQNQILQKLPGVNVNPAGMGLSINPIKNQVQLGTQLIINNTINIIANSSNKLEDYTQTIEDVFNMSLEDKNNLNIENMLSLDRNTKKNLVILVNPSKETLGLYSTKVPNDTEVLSITEQLQFGSIFFPECSDDEKRYFALGYANYLQKLKKYETWYILGSEEFSKENKTCWNFLKTEQHKINPSEYSKDIPERIMEILNQKKYTFLNKNRKLYPTTKLLMDVDLFMSNLKDVAKTKDFLTRLANFFSGGLNIACYSVKHTEEEFLRVVKNKIYHQFIHTEMSQEEMRSGFDLFDE